MVAEAAAQSIKIGYVSLARIEKESGVAARATETLKQEFEPRQLRLREAQQRIVASRQQFESEKSQLSPADAQARGRELSEMMIQSEQAILRFTEEFNLRKNQLRAKLIEEARAAIKIVAEAGEFDAILQEAVFARPGIDITEQVLKELAGRPAAAP